MHTNRILQVGMFRRKFCLMKWKKHSLCKNVRDEKNYSRLRNNLCQFKNIFQYVYSCVYPDVYCSTKRKGFDLKSLLQLVFKTYKYKKKNEQAGKNP